MRQLSLTGGWPLLCGLLALLAGCASTSARPVSSYSGPTLAKPERVLVVDFAVRSRAARSRAKGHLRTRISSSSDRRLPRFYPRTW
jgi:hypothetical protein